MNYEDFYYPLAESGDIIYCNFPDRKDLDTKYHGSPFKDPHYCLVLASDKASESVLVMYGTSKINKYGNKKGLLLNNEFKKETNLIKPTKFIFDQESIALIPYNKRYINKKNYKIVVGCLPKIKYSELRVLLSNEGFLKYKNELVKNNNIIISKNTMVYF